MLRFVLQLMVLALPLTACAQSAAPPKLGETYVLAPKPGTWLPEKGKIEVVEYFSYTCGHCAEFQPMIDAWKKSMPKDVVFHYLPNAVDLEFPYSRAHFAAEKLGVLPKVHNDLFVAIHEDGRLPRNNATIEELGTYLAQRGADRAKAVASMRSEAVSAQMKRAYQFIVDKRLQATPTLVVAGKYVVKGDSYQEYLDHLNAVVAMERARRRTPAVPMAPAQNAPAPPAKKPATTP
jgi:protein dithiol oxidoreductase (disulfide-forming)